MTTETLKRLIAGGEALNVEFKGEQRSALNDSDLVEAVVCLANCTGTEPSWLLIGVEDDGSVAGACPRHGNATEPHKVAALIAGRTRPALSVHVEVVILNALWQERSLVTEDASLLTQKPEGETRATLHRLLEAGLVEERGQKRGRTWHLSAATYRALGDKAAYVRQRGFEPLQQEQMVLQYVEKHGSIGRSETAELCRLGSQQAYRLLKRLEESAKIRRLGGSTKAVRYGSASNCSLARNSRSALDDLETIQIYERRA